MEFEYNANLLDNIPSLWSTDAFAWDIFSEATSERKIYNDGTWF